MPWYHSDHDDTVFTHNIPYANGEAALKDLSDRNTEHCSSQPNDLNQDKSQSSETMYPPCLTIPHNPLIRSLPEPDTIAGSYLSASPTYATMKMYRSMHDSIHNHMTLHPLLISIVDTPQFQRLRTVCQLGVVSWLFPGAVHTRFEHCIGVSFLAMKLIGHLRYIQGDEYNITSKDELCVVIAGLCHDLGHGPYSHLFEEYVNVHRARTGKAPWHHEHCSVAMFRYLIQCNNIPLEQYGLNHQEDVNFICALIRGLRPQEPWPKDIGRPEKKRFLFEIVSNKRNGIDVDKLDYFLRDSMHCYGRLPVDVNVDRIIQCARILWCDGQYQICFEQKVALSLGDVFSLRAKLHKYVYQHRVVLILQKMVLDVFMNVSDNFELRGRKLYDVVEDMAIFTTLGDWILHYIGSTDCPELAPARNVLNRIQSRRLYKLVAHTVTTRPESALQASDLLPYLDPSSSARHDIFIVHANIKYSSETNEHGGIDDPLNHVRFFNPKEEVPRAHALHVRHLGGLFSPSVLCEVTSFVCVHKDYMVQEVYDAFLKWRHETKNRRGINANDLVINSSEIRGNLNTPPRKRNRTHCYSTGVSPSDTIQFTPLTPPEPLF